MATDKATTGKRRHELAAQCQRAQRCTQIQTTDEKRNDESDTDSHGAARMPRRTANGANGTGRRRVQMRGAAGGRGWAPRPGSACSVAPRDPQPRAAAPHSQAGRKAPGGGEADQRDTGRVRERWRRSSRRSKWRMGRSHPLRPITYIMYSCAPAPVARRPPGSRALRTLRTAPRWWLACTGRRRHEEDIPRDTRRCARQPTAVVGRVARAPSPEAGSRRRLLQSLLGVWPGRQRHAQAPLERGTPRSAAEGGCATYLRTARVIVCWPARCLE